jgi:hypothetical protein
MGVDLTDSTVAGGGTLVVWPPGSWLDQRVS